MVLLTSLFESSYSYVHWVYNHKAVAESMKINLANKIFKKFLCAQLRSYLVKSTIDRKGEPFENDLNN